MTAPAPSATVALARRSIAHHSKSFSLAARLLPAGVRDEAAIVYAWCRRADDAIDLAAPSDPRHRLRALSVELDAVYSSAPLDEPILAGFQDVVRRRRIPRRYPEELLAGMEMDVASVTYHALSDLGLYCFRVAGTVGLMMCHVMGVRRSAALVRAAHLGMAMQLTNICRDVLEDWERERLYLPEAMLSSSGAGALRAELGRPFPAWARGPVARVTRSLLDEAERYYRSGDAGLAELSLRCAFGVRSARLIYARIGAELRARDCDPLAGRAVVSKPRKLSLAARAAGETLLRLPVRLWRARLTIPDRELEFADVEVPS